MPGTCNQHRIGRMLPNTLILPTRWKDLGPRGSCPHCGAKDGIVPVLTTDGKREKWCRLCVRWSIKHIRRFVPEGETKSKEA